MVAMFVFQSGPNEETLYRTLHMCFLPNFNQLGQMVLEKKKLIGQSQTRNAMVAILELCLIGMEYGNLAQDIPYNFPIK
jgi:hypothetical protein